MTRYSERGQTSLGVFVLAKNAGGDEFVDELLHAVERREESLRRHDDAERRFRSRRLPVGARLKRDKVKPNHVAREMNLTNAVDVIFFFHRFHLSLTDFQRRRELEPVSKNDAAMQD